MALTSLEEAWVKKQAQIRLRELQIEDLQETMSANLVPVQSQITAIQADYSAQIAAKNNEINVLKAEIKALV